MFQHLVEVIICFGLVDPSARSRTLSSILLHSDTPMSHGYSLLYLKINVFMNFLGCLLFQKTFLWIQAFLSVKCAVAQCFANSEWDPVLCTVDWLIIACLLFVTLLTDYWIFHFLDSLPHAKAECKPCAFILKCSVQSELKEAAQMMTQHIEAIEEDSVHRYYAEPLPDMPRLSPNHALSQKAGYLFLRT